MLEELIVHGQWGRRGAVAACAIVASLGSMPADAADTHAQHVVRRGMLITTGGDLDFRERSAPVRAGRPARSASGDDLAWWRESWLYHMLNSAPSTSRPNRQTVAPTRPRPVAAAQSAVAPIVAEPKRAPAIATTLVAPPPAPAVRQPAVPAPISTSSIAPMRMSAATSEASLALVRAADRAQARVDLVKFELAARTYNERRLSGQSAFDLRSDWRVLERARDALTGAELSAAEAAGFEGNAYINEAERTIVVALASTRDLRREFAPPAVWQAGVTAERAQIAFIAKSYVRSVMQRYQMQGYTSECVGHSIGGGACLYASAELGIRALVVNPMSFGTAAQGDTPTTTYLVDGEIAAMVPDAAPGRGTGAPASRELQALIEQTYGPVSGAVNVVREIGRNARPQRVERVLDVIAAHAEAERAR